jgi:hypothetical protein
VVGIQRGFAWRLLHEQIERLPIGRVLGVQVAQQSEELLTLEGTAAVEVETLHPGVNLRSRRSALGAPWRWLNDTKVRAWRACLELLLLLPLLPLVVVLSRATSRAASLL